MFLAIPKRMHSPRKTSGKLYLDQQRCTLTMKIKCRTVPNIERQCDILARGGDHSLVASHGCATSLSCEAKKTRRARQVNDTNSFRKHAYCLSRDSHTDSFGRHVLSQHTESCEENNSTLLHNEDLSTTQKEYHFAPYVVG